MRPLSALERLLERAFERPTARLFRTPLSVVVVERRIERAIEVERRRSAGRTVVPDDITVALRGVDLEALSAAAGSEAELASGLAGAALAFVRRHGYVPSRVPTVALVVDPTVPSGDVRVAAVYSAGGARGGGHVGARVGAHVGGLETADAGRPSGPGRSDHTGGGEPTLAFPVATDPPRALATLVVREPRGLVRRLPLDGSPVVIGRDAACDVVLDDHRASRRHARIQARGGYLVLSDLGSTNGTYIRSERVSEVTLGLGDSVMIGDSTLELTPVSVDDLPGAPGSPTPDAPRDAPADAPADAPWGDP